MDAAGEPAGSTLLQHWTGAVSHYREMYRQKKYNQLWIRGLQTWPSAEVATARMTIAVAEVSLENMFVKET